MNCYIRYIWVFWICSHAKSHCDIWTCILWGICWGRYKLSQIKIRICNLMHNLLTRSIPCKIHWWNSIFYCISKLPAKSLVISVKKQAYSLSARKNTDCHLCIRKSLYIVENHCWSVLLCRTHYSSTRTYISVNT